MLLIPCAIVSYDALIGFMDTNYSKRDTQNKE